MASAENTNRLTVLKLCTSKVDLLRDILRVTREMTFHTPDEAEKYVTLIERRQIWFNRISAIDTQILTAEAEAYAETSANEAEEIAKMKAEVRELAADILDLDMKMKEQVIRINTELRQHVKTSRQSRNIVNVYSPDRLYGGGHIDSRK